MNILNNFDLIDNEDEEEYLQVNDNDNNEPLLQNDINDNQNLNLNFSRQMQQRVKKNENKISLRSALSFLKLVLLYFCVYLEGFYISPFLTYLLIFLIVSDLLFIFNYIQMKIYFIYKRARSQIVLEMPTYFQAFDGFNKLIGFSWFLYGCYSMIYDEFNRSESVKKNPLTTYYILILVVFGFLMYGKILIFLTFFILFSPCLGYSLIKDLIVSYRKKNRISRLIKQLKSLDYEEYKNKYITNNVGSGDIQCTCVICSDDYKPKDKVCFLKCSNKHVFHFECIKQWIYKKPTCPFCRYDLLEENEQKKDEQIENEWENMPPINDYNQI